MVESDKELESAKKKLLEKFSENYQNGLYYTDWSISSNLEGKSPMSIAIQIARIVNDKGFKRGVGTFEGKNRAVESKPPKPDEVKGHQLRLMFTKRRWNQKEEQFEDESRDFPIYLTEKEYKDLVEFLPPKNWKIISRKMIVTGEYKFRDGEWKPTYYHDR